MPRIFVCRSSGASLIALLLLLGSLSAPTAVGADKKQHSKKNDLAEVEIYAQVKRFRHADHYRLFASKRPCEQLGAEQVIDSSRLQGTGPGMVEIFFAQGTLVYICVAGLNTAEEVIALGGYDKNPVTCKGDGEIVFRDIEITLKANADKRSFPKNAPPIPSRR
jgi:hypothetical protein